MTIDPIATANLVTHNVETGTRDNQPTRIVIASRTYPTDAADLWDAVTNPERLPRWFSPVEGDLQLGGTYQVENNAGGTIERCDKPDRIDLTWEAMGNVSWVRITFTETVDGTILQLAHEATIEEEFWTQFGPGATGVGWDLAFLGLGLHIGDGTPEDRKIIDDWADFDADWTFTDPGKQFTQHAAEDWARAAINDGDDPEVANTAATNTIAFYTTIPDESQA